MQAEIMEWFSQNLVLTVSIFIIIFIMILAIYIKLFVHLIYEGITFRHFRKGRLLRESYNGGLVVLIPFLDKLELIPPCEPALLDPNDFSVKDDFE
ncbi:hypothetical protein EU528_04925 [Candidatus Thorarchaeota archaeon]|nr:MAG: hypothetical protein EU528_04925 [Candidatus Thorarchaeota archaeon]